MIRVTEAAAKKMQELLGDQGKGLRLLVSKGGCAGWQYGMKVDSHQEGDLVIETDGGLVYIDQESSQWLSKAEVDYSDSLSDAGFKINNPNAARSCGCGTSFEPAQEGQAPQYEPSMDGTVCKSEEEA